MEFYQPRFWGLDPLFSAKPKLYVSDVLNLQEYPNFPGVYCLLNHPVLGVHIMGDVVSISQRNLLILYEVDDGSGVIPCCQWRKVEGSNQGLLVPGLGQLVSVYGRVSEFRGERQLRVYSIVPEDDPNAEPLHWLEVAQLKRRVYTKPFTLPPGVSTSAPWLSERTVQKSLKEAVSESLLQYLKGIPFTLSQLQRDGQLRQTCLDAVRTNCDCSVWTEVSQELTRVIWNLPQSGHVIPVMADCEKLGKEIVYELLSDEKHLFPVIMDYMKDKLQHPRAAKLGVPEEWIVQFLRQKAVFSQLPSSRISRAIEHLSENSLIFPVGTKVYKCVT